MLHLVVATLLAAAQAEVPSSVVRVGPRAIDAPSYLVGRLIPDVAFVDLSGKAGALSDYQSSRLLVLCITSTDCPIARKYTPRIVELEQRYRGKGVAFAMVNPQAHETAQDMREAVQRANIGFRYVPDPEAHIAGALRATSTTEVFVLDSARTLVYRGAIDDQYGLGFTLPEIRRALLTDALDALLADDVPLVRATTAPGCELALAEAKEPAPAASITWNNRISRIVQDNCQICHRTGAVGPFELLTYEDVQDHSKTIKREVERRSMPPWFAEGPRGHWANDARLTDEDRADFLAWIAAGTPEGDAKDAPRPRPWRERWQLREPDAVFEAVTPVAVAAEGAMPYQDVTIKVSLPDDRWIGEVEVRNTQPQVVHHVLTFLMFPSDHPNAGEQMVNTRGNKGCFAWMAPGSTLTKYPAGMAKLLPHGVDLLMQIHYTPNGEAVTDRPSIAFKFVDKPTYELKTRAAENRTFEIPPGAEHYPVSGTYRFDNPARIISLFGHTHMRGVGFQYELILPDGTTTTVLDLPRYDYNWQLTYTLNEPLDVPAGAVLKATGYYDNSAKNPANPDPTKPAKFGLQTWDEMMLAYFTAHALPTDHPVPDRDEMASVSTTQKIRKWMRQNRAAAFGGAALLALAAVGIVILFRTRTNARTSLP